MTADHQPRAYVAYARVSTEKQGRSGLGLEAQRAAVADYLNGGDWVLLREFVEVESGKRDDAPSSPRRWRAAGCTTPPW